MAPDPIEHAVNSLPPFMQRRMAKLSLAGARFVQEAHGICAWKVEDRNGAVGGRYTHLAEAVNETWREWLMALGSRDADMEMYQENLTIAGL